MEKRIEFKTSSLLLLSLMIAGCYSSDQSKSSGYLSGYPKSPSSNSPIATATPKPNLIVPNVEWRPTVKSVNVIGNSLLIEGYNLEKVTAVKIISPDGTARPVSITAPGSNSLYVLIEGAFSFVENMVYQLVVSTANAETSIPMPINFKAISANGLAVGGTQLVTESGRVGIGTSAPAYLLDVYGEVRSTGGYSLNGQNMDPGVGNPTRSDGGGFISQNASRGNMEMDFIAPAFEVGPIAFEFRKLTGSSAPFAVSDPLVSISRNGNLNVSGNISANSGSVSAQTGNLSTSSGHIFTQTGNLSTSSGHIFSQTGNVSTSSGHVFTRTGNITTLGGKIGIGLSDPLYAVDIISSGLALRGLTYNDPIDGPTIELGAIRTSGSNNVAISSGTPLGAIYFSGMTGSSMESGAKIHAMSTSGFTATSSPANLEFYTTSSGSNRPALRMTISSNGNIYANSTVFAGNQTSCGLIGTGTGLTGCSSDARIKKDVQTYKHGLSELLKLRPVTYKFNGLGGHEDQTTEHIGVIAQEVEPFLPEIIGQADVKLHPNDDKLGSIKTVQYGAFPMLLINAVKEFYAKFHSSDQENKVRLESLQSEIQLKDKEIQDLKLKIKNFTSSYCQHFPGDQVCQH